MSMEIKNLLEILVLPNSKLNLFFNTVEPAIINVAVKKYCYRNICFFSNGN